MRIDAQLRGHKWEILNTKAVCFDYALSDRTKANYVFANTPFYDSDRCSEPLKDDKLWVYGVPLACNFYVLG